MSRIHIVNRTIIRMIIISNIFLSLFIMSATAPKPNVNDNREDQEANLADDFECVDVMQLDDNEEVHEAIFTYHEAYAKAIKYQQTIKSYDFDEQAKNTIIDYANEEQLNENRQRAALREKLASKIAELAEANRQLFDEIDQIGVILRPKKAMIKVAKNKDKIKSKKNKGTKEAEEETDDEDEKDSNCNAAQSAQHYNEFRNAIDSLRRAMTRATHAYDSLTKSREWYRYSCLRRIYHTRQFWPLTLIATIAVIGWSIFYRRELAFKLAPYWRDRINRQEGDGQDDLHQFPPVTYPPYYTEIVIPAAVLTIALIGILAYIACRLIEIRFTDLFGGKWRKSPPRADNRLVSSPSASSPSLFASRQLAPPPPQWSAPPKSAPPKSASILKRTKL